jgi:hypothetical protein
MMVLCFNWEQKLKEVHFVSKGELIGGFKL